MVGFPRLLLGLRGRSGCLESSQVLQIPKRPDAAQGEEVRIEERVDPFLRMIIVAVCFCAVLLRAGSDVQGRKDAD